MRDIFRGKLIRLAADEPEALAKAEIRWQRDSEFLRLADNEAVHLTSEKKLRESFEKHLETGFKPDRYSFTIRALEEDKPIGFLGLRLDLIHNDAMIGIGIGGREHWDKGYGTDAMKVCLRYAFTELNLHRVSLGLHEYNPRALRAYEKAGFKLEGKTRGDLAREGRRYDSFWMGILREEWKHMENGELA
ncbi:MAG TPA: GNAT family protein [Anaerolineales bacterium]|nr:GNAT family protein [Anaerolineales bacterium]